MLIDCASLIPFGEFIPEKGNYSARQKVTTDNAAPIVCLFQNKMMFLSKLCCLISVEPLLSAEPLLSGHLTVSQGWPANL